MLTVKRASIYHMNSRGSMKYWLFSVTVVGWLMALVVHVLSLLDIDVRSGISFLWVLDAAFLVVLVPTFWQLRRFGQTIQHEKRGFMTYPKLVCSITPLWLMVIMGSGFAYAVLNFLIFLASYHGSPVVLEGNYVLQDQGNVVKMLNLQEFAHYRAIEVGLSSGLLIALFGISMTVFFPFRSDLVMARKRMVV